jgi:hypothetical protein
VACGAALPPLQAVTSSLAGRLPPGTGGIHARLLPGCQAEGVEPRSGRSRRERDITQLTAPIRTRLRLMQYRPGLLTGFLTGTRLDLTSLQ